MNICGTECGMCAKMIRLVKLYSLLKAKNSLSTSLTGATFKLVPITTSRSTSSRSLNRHSSNSESRAWPKKVISGCTIY